MSRTIARRAHDREAVRYAAMLLEGEALLQRESCDIGDRHWACADCTDKEKCSSRVKHEDLLASAKKLRSVVRRIR